MAKGTIVFYIYHEGDKDGTEFAEYDNSADWKSEFQKYLDLKKSEGKELEDYDKLMRDCVFYGVKVLRPGFKKLMRTLRHFDEIGISNEVYESMEEIYSDESVVAISIGTPSVKAVDFKEYTI